MSDDLEVGSVAEPVESEEVVADEAVEETVAEEVAEEVAPEAEAAV